MNRYNIDARMKDCRKQKTCHNISSSVAVFRFAFLRSLSNTHTHKSQAGLSLHDRAKLLWLNTQEYGMIKVSGAFWVEMETWFITLHTTADWNVKRLNTQCVAWWLSVCFNENIVPYSCKEALTVCECCWDFNTIHVFLLCLSVWSSLIILSRHVWILPSK